MQRSQVEMESPDECTCLMYIGPKNFAIGLLMFYRNFKTYNILLR